MKSAKIIGFVVLALMFGTATLDIGSSTHPFSVSFISKAEAVVGRPLTPVSYAGVARRTARRCANGTYNC